jgi:hypothetical protein
LLLLGLGQAREFGAIGYALNLAHAGLVASPIEWLKGARRCRGRPGRFAVSQRAYFQTRPRVAATGDAKRDALLEKITSFKTRYRAAINRSP